MPLRKALTYLAPTGAPQALVAPAPPVQDQVAISPELPPALTQLAKAALPAYTGGRKSTSDTMSKADWAAKDTRISRQGLFQAALQSPALMQYAPDLDAYLVLVRKVADAGLVYVNE